MVLKSTLNYNQVNFLPFNRKSEVRKSLIKSFNLFGWLVPITCIKTDIFGEEALYAVDGQHRYATAKFLGLPIKYIELNIPIKNKNYLVYLTALLNSSAVQWKITDYVKAYCTIQKEDYQFLDRKAGESGLSHTTIACLYSGRLRSVDVTSTIKNGIFEVTHREEGDIILSHLSKLNNIVKFTNRMSMGFTAFYRGRKNVDVDKFKQRLQANLPLLADISETTAFSGIFDKIYTR